MPEGFESQLDQNAMNDLLEFLTTKGKYVPISLAKVATAVSTKGLISRRRSRSRSNDFPRLENESL